MAVFREQDVAAAQSEVYLRRQDLGTEQHVVAVSHWSKYVDAVLRYASIYDASEELGPLIHRMPGDQSTHAVRNDCSASFVNWYTRLIGR